MFVHTVVTGDTLEGIARIYGTSRRELTRLNELGPSDVLVPGLHLLVPGAPTVADPYRVQAGDTTTALARRFGISVRDFERWTGLRTATGGQLTAGTEVYGPRRITSKRTIEVNAYLLPQGTPSDERILRDLPHMTYASMFSYPVRADGSLQPLKDRQGLAGAAQTRTAPLVTVSNFDGSTFSTELAHTILTDAAIRRRLIANIVRLMRERGYRGVNMDFEHMGPEDRPLYNSFIREVGEAVRPEGYSLSIAMGPKTADNPQASWMGAFDYRTLGGLVDFLMLMTYEWGWVGGPPLPVAPIRQVRAVLEYATSVIDPNKILMGMPLYGYDWEVPWQKGQLASSVSANAAQDLALGEQVPIRWNASDASPYYEYTQVGRNHLVWFEDAMSAAAKFGLVYEYGLRGVSFWVLPNEFPQLWYMLRDTFEVRKLL